MSTIPPPKDKLGCLIPGLGAVTSTFLAGCELIKNNESKPIGSLTQMGTVRIGRRDDGTTIPIKELVPLDTLDNIEYLTWDIFPDSAYDVAQQTGILHAEHIAAAKKFLQSIKPLPGVFDRNFVKRLDGRHIKSGRTLYDLYLQLEQDILHFKREKQLARMVMIWCASTEIYTEPSEVHQTLKDFEQGLKNNASNISPSMIYAYTALKNHIPFFMGAPNVCAEIPAFFELANKTKTPFGGKDFKTGQTLMKTIIAPGMKSRLLGISGWFSTNILGNRDGEVLDDPGSFRSKEVSKLGVLDYILQPELYPDLYSDLYHKVCINYYPPRGDNKEGWDNIDIFGWLEYPMQIKVNFLCRDSILAAPMVLDLLLFGDLAKRIGLYGIQEWLSFYFKSPIVSHNLYPEHDLNIQLTKLKNTLRYFSGKELITHLGLEYFEGMQIER